MTLTCVIVKRDSNVHFVTNHPLTRQVTYWVSVVGKYMSIILGSLFFIIYKSFIKVLVVVIC